jgi:hypothetical protein
VYCPQYSHAIYKLAETLHQRSIPPHWHCFQFQYKKKEAKSVRLGWGGVTLLHFTPIIAGHSNPLTTKKTIPQLELFLISLDCTCTSHTLPIQQTTMKITTFPQLFTDLIRPCLPAEAQCALTRLDSFLQGMLVWAEGRLTLQIVHS